MNKAITDGLLLMPPAFAGGLSVWSSGDGTAGSPGYAGAGNAALVPADQDFGGCLELVKTEAVQKLRFTGETPILPGCYLEITARVKAISGALPSVRIAGHAMGAGPAHVAGLVEVGPAIALSSYGEVVTVRAIVGTGARGGVGMVWGSDVLYGHFGLDFLGANGGTVRIDDIRIEDVTHYFQREMMDWVDVRDYGARGDGVTNDVLAFRAADAAAQGRTVLVPGGTYFLNDHLSMVSPVRFQGSLAMPADRRLSLTRNFDLPSYAAAFGDEVTGFRKGMQALLSFSDHDTFDLGGRRIEVSGPIDVHAAVVNKTSFAGRRLIRNGQFNVVANPAWDSVTVTSAASYSATNPYVLTGVANIANIPVGSRVTGTGVGREVYVRAVNVGAGSLTLNLPLYAPAATQTYTFTRDRYVLDFSGFAALERIEFADVEFLCDGIASGVLLPPDGLVMQFRDCVFNKPKDRGITSHGEGCQGIIIDRCQFLSNEQALRAQDRHSIGFNVNANDAKIRNCRAVRFAHFGVLAGSGNIVSGNHFFQGDSEVDGLRGPGLVFTQANVKTAVTGNYIDNCSIEWTNEHDPEPAQVNETSFGGLTVVGNHFTASDTAAWFRWFVVRPCGAGHYIQGLNLSGNVFKSINGTVERIEGVDASIAPLDNGRMRNIVVTGNTFTGVTQFCANPALMQFDQNTVATTWTIDFGPMLPFGGWARNVESFVKEGPVTGASNEIRIEMPYVTVEQGAAKQEVRLNWAVAAKGRVQVVARVDNYL